MSLTRQFFRELRPLVRMLDEPLGRSPAYWGSHWGSPATRSFLEDPFVAMSNALRPAVDVREQADKYVVEAELPGVKKENVNVRIGDGGRTITIEGKLVRGTPESQTQQEAQQAQAAETSGTSDVPASQTDQTAISTERTFTGTASFTRTVVLPRPVDTSKVSAKLTDGILTLTVPKAAEEPGSVQVNVE